MTDKKSISERDICTKFITPAVEKSGWNKLTHGAFQPRLAGEVEEAENIES